MNSAANKFLSLSFCVMTLAACNNVENKKNSDMTTHKHLNKENDYACPMHPEVTGKHGDSCSKCGMDLVAVNPTTAKDFRVMLHTSPNSMEAGKPVDLNFAIKHNEKIVPLDISHEMKFHLMLVSEDLSWFRHIHPEEQTDGTFMITETFPAAGKYLLFSDFKPSGAEQIVNKQEIEVQGESRPKDKLDANPYLSKVDGYTVSLLNGSDFRTNRTQDLQISIEKDGRKLKETDLQQYLGASAHIVMIGKVDKEFLHIHPVSDSRFPVFAQTHIADAGVYRMWAQFKIDGIVHTADFTVEVAAGEKGHAHEAAHAHQH